MGAEYFPGAPQFIIEVISEGSRSHDLRAKAAHYREHVVREYWAVDFEEKVLYHHLLTHPHDPYLVSKHAEGRVESEAIPRFWLEVSWLWQEALPRGFECWQRM